MKSKVALAVAIALAVLAAVGIRAFLTRAKHEFRGEQKMVPVLIAAKNITKGNPVYSDMVTKDNFDQRVVQDGRTVFPSQLGKIVGKTILKDVRAGEPILWSYFSTRAEKKDPARGLPLGYRQITIPVDKVTGCAGRLLPGTVVDVLATLRVPRDARGAVEPVTQIVLTNMRVEAPDLRSREGYTFLSAREQRDYAAYSTVTLRALPLQATLLAFLADQAKIHLVIRSPDDPTGQDPTKLEKVTLDQLDALIEKASKAKPLAAESAP